MWPLSGTMRWNDGAVNAVKHLLGNALERMHAAACLTRFTAVLRPPLLHTTADQPARAGAAGVHLRHLQGRAGAAAVHALQPRLLQAVPAEDGALVLRVCRAVRARKCSCSTQFQPATAKRLFSANSTLANLVPCFTLRHQCSVLQHDAQNAPHFLLS